VVRHTTQERAALIAAAPAMQKALEFYADSASWKRKRATGGWPIAESQPAAKDRGKRARAALGQDK
jgi:hypothetical protein